MGETQIIAPLSQLLQVPLVVSDLEAIGNYHTIWAGIYGCLNSVEKLRPVSPTHHTQKRGDGCASGIATQERTNIR
jgi:hypothetical protein